MAGGKPGRKLFARAFTKVSLSDRMRRFGSHISFMHKGETKMGNVLLVYATMSGNTEAMADLIEKGLIQAQASVDRYEAMDIHAELLMITSIFY